MFNVKIQNWDQYLYGPELSYEDIFNRIKVSSSPEMYITYDNCDCLFLIELCWCADGYFIIAKEEERWRNMINTFFLGVDIPVIGLKHITRVVTSCINHIASAIFSMSFEDISLLPNEVYIEIMMNLDKLL